MALRNLMIGTEIFAAERAPEQYTGISLTVMTPQVLINFFLESPRNSKLILGNLKIWFPNDLYSRYIQKSVFKILKLFISRENEYQ